MARGAAQARRKAAKPPPKRKRTAAPTYEQTMFFPRLRRQAKWVFVFLALVFGIGFVAFGVGSGSTGISDILRGNFFGGGGSSTGSRIKADEKKLDRNPKDISTYLDLAGLYQQDNKEAQAIATLERAASVAPKNVDVLNRLAGIYSGQSQRALTDAQNAQIELEQNISTMPGLDPRSTLGQAMSQDPVSQALQQKYNDAYQKMILAFRKTESAYQRVVAASAGTSEEANAQLQLASAAEQATDIATAIKAYERFLKLAPQSTNAAAIRQHLKQLRASLPPSQR